MWISRTPLACYNSSDDSSSSKVVVVRKFFLLTLAAVALYAAASPSWLDLVAPIITPAQKKLYLSLKPEAREAFEQDFWSQKSIAPEEYSRRVQYIDANFGSGRLGSGANTDQGRIYLSIGPPTKVVRFPSSRIFFPLEIWYYDVMPDVLNTELRLIFYQKNNIGFPKLYSPTLDTFRALLIPQAGVQDTFGPNDSLTESDIRKTMTVPPAEDEIISAASNIATGIKYQGNEEILGQISSPMYMLGKSLRTSVRSRLVASHPRLDILTTVSPYGGLQVDLGLEPIVHHELNVQVLEGEIPVYQNQLHLKFEKPELVRYTHRLDLLPGSYRVMFTVDGTVHPYLLEVKDQPAMSEIVRADPAGVAENRQTPFEFEGKQLDLNSEGKFAVVAVPHPGKVNWTLREGAQVIWRSSSEASQIAMVELPTTGFGPGTYKLEANSDSGSRTMVYVFNKDKVPSTSTVLSFNANLAPALRFAAIGHQWLLKGKINEARHSLEASLESGSTREGHVEMARLDASTGRYDEARDRLRRILAALPNDFDALSTLAFVEASLQDYQVAADLYRRALAVQDSPAIRLALSKLPKQ